MASIGLPITNDPLYPRVLDVAADDFARPLQLLAQRLEFEDPLTGETRCFTTGRTL
jgi:tRNA pseudouridine32 synthase/23S rRNA pseudouridine746 synthase